MNISRIRRDFPILSSTMREKPFVYLDSAATSLTPEPVIEAVNRYYREYGVNIHRGIYELSERATREFENVREALNVFLNVPAHGQVIFTHGCTEGANTVAVGWGRKFLKAGDLILSTEYEHHSSLVPWHVVCEKNATKMAFIPIDRESLSLDLAAYKNLLTEKVKVLVIGGMSNVTGYLPPLKEMISLAHDNGTVVVLDAAQLVSHCPVDVADLDPDFFFFSAHKMLGPTGVGVLYAKTALLDAMDPFMYGGNMILQVTKDHSTWHSLPQKFEAGTPNIAGVLGLGRALEYLSNLGMENIAAHEQRLMKYLRERLTYAKSLISYLPAEQHQQGGILSFNVEGIHNHDIGALLDAQGIAVRTGFHCAMPLMNVLGVVGTVRASVYCYNCTEDIDSLCDGIEQARKLFAT